MQSSNLRSFPPGPLPGSGQSDLVCLNQVCLYPVRPNPVCLMPFVWMQSVWMLSVSWQLVSVLAFCLSLPVDSLKFPHWLLLFVLSPFMFPRWFGLCL